MTPTVFSSTVFSSTVFSSIGLSPTAVPRTTPLVVAPQGDVSTILRPFILIGVVAFMAGFMGYLAIGGPRAAVAQDRDPPAAVSTPAATPVPDAFNPPKPV